MLESSPNDDSEILVELDIVRSVRMKALISGMCGGATQGCVARNTGMCGAQLPSCTREVCGLNLLWLHHSQYKKNV